MPKDTLLRLSLGQLGQTVVTKKWGKNFREKSHLARAKNTVSTSMMGIVRVNKVIMQGVFFISTSVAHALVTMQLWIAPLVRQKTEKSTPLYCWFCKQNIFQL